MGGTKQPLGGSGGSKTSPSAPRRSRSSAKHPKSTAIGTSSSPPPPTARGKLPTLILDSGGATVKHGLLLPLSSSTVTCREVPNATARPRHQLTILSADEIHTVKNQGQLDFVRPLERGYATDLGCQLRVWNRVLELEGVAGAPTASMAALVLPPQGKKRKGGGTISPVPIPVKANEKKIPSGGCCVFILVQPFTPRVVSERVDEILFRDFGFARVGRWLVQCASARRYLGELVPPGGDGSASRTKQEGCDVVKSETGKCAASQGTRWRGSGSRVVDDGTGCCCVVDSGFSLTQVVPTFEGRAVERAIRRVNIGGKLLTNLLKEAITYRQWNMMDEYAIVNEAKEKLCFVSTDFDNEIRKARNVRVGHRWFDRDFVLPDFSDTFTGTVRLTPPLQREKDLEEAKKVAAAATAAAVLKKGGQKKGKGQVLDALEPNDDADQDVNMTNANAATGSSRDENKSEHADDGDSDDNDEEETEEQRRRRILKQKEAERRQRELEEQERQVLSLSVERFAIPEVLFRPSDVGLQQAGIPDAIVQAIELCDPTLRAAMYHNVLLTGGNAKIPQFRERVEMELRALAPDRYPVRVVVPDDAVRYAWEGARDFVRSGDDFLQSACVDRDEWEGSMRTGGKDHKSVWEWKERPVDGFIVM